MALLLNNKEFAMQIYNVLTIHSLRIDHTYLRLEANTIAPLYTPEM